MHYAEIVGQVQERANLGDEEEALAAAQATLETLGERLSADEAEQLASMLPDELGHFVADGASRGRAIFGLDGFLDRVSEREGVDREVAREHARVVLEVLREATSAAELGDLRLQLGADFERLFRAGQAGPR